MIYQELHTYTLEKLFGPVRNRVIRQDNKLRMVHLIDNKNTSRTLGVVRFHEIINKDLNEVHETIREGAMLGKTLLEFNIDFDKEFIGSVNVEMPEWLKKEFKTKQKQTKAFLSKIKINQIGSEEGTLYTELIEVIPPEYISEFNQKIKDIQPIDANWRTLAKEADLKIYPE
jgi:hypothetical protein